MAEGEPDLLAERRRRRDAAAAADGAHADGPARAVRHRRAEEVHDRGRAGRPAWCRSGWRGRDTAFRSAHWRASWRPAGGGPEGAVKRSARDEGREIER